MTQIPHISITERAVRASCALRSAVLIHPDKPARSSKAARGSQISDILVWCVYYVKREVLRSEVWCLVAHLSLHLNYNRLTLHTGIGFPSAFANRKLGTGPIGTGKRDCVHARSLTIR